MTSRLNDARILMYSHDSFGLGHLRRCRTIAHALVEDYRGLNVLIISGATIAGAFDYRARVDFVKIPSVIKLRNGEYTSMDRHIDLQETLKMRRSIIYHTAESFQPDIFIVDEEPMGLRGEVEETLAYFDGINFADRITCPIIVNIGLQDNVCPPETGYALFHRIGAADKRLYTYDGHGHDAGRDQHGAIVDQFFARQLWNGR